MRCSYCLGNSKEYLEKFSVDGHMCVIDAKTNFKERNILKFENFFV